MKVLLVEDDDLLRQSLACLFEGRGHQVFQYENGDGAIEYAEDLQPDITLTDFNLGVGDNGLTIARHLIKKGQKAILMSSDYTIKDRSWNAGVPFIEKIKVSDLIGYIEKMASQ